MPRSYITVAALVLLAACRPSAPSARPAETPRTATVTSPQEEPDTKPPADVSHGEAPIGGPGAEPAPRLAKLAPAERTRLHRIRLEMQPRCRCPSLRACATRPGPSAAACPGPRSTCARATRSTSPWSTRANIPHSMDFHAAEIAPSKYYVNVMPGDSLHYRFVARVPGRLHVPLRHRPGGDAHRERHVRRDDRGPGHAAAQGPGVRLRAERVLPDPEARRRRHPEPRLGASSSAWRRTTSSSTGGPTSTPPTRSRSRPERAAPALRGERRPQPDQLVPRGRRNLRAGVPGRHRRRTP